MKNIYIQYMDIIKGKYSVEYCAKYVKTYKDIKDTIEKSDEEGKYGENITEITQKWLKDLDNTKKKINKETFNIYKQRYI